MKLFAYIDRINLIHKLVRECRTGSPKEFACRLGMSESRLYQLIEELKIMGVPIVYSRLLRSYHYSEPFKLAASIEMLSLEESALISGKGNYFIYN